MTKQEIIERCNEERTKLTVATLNFFALYLLSLRYGTPVMAAFYGHFAAICGSCMAAMSIFTKKLAAKWAN